MHDDSEQSRPADDYARRQVGVPYVWGDTPLAAWDCSAGPIKYEWSTALLADVENAAAALGAALRPAFRSFTAAASQLGSALSPVAGMLELLAHDVDRQQRPRWHRRRCPTCNPAAFNTAPSGRMGREYHRRQLARRRRNRRHH